MADRGATRHGTAFLGLATVALLACRTGDFSSMPADPRVILGAHISHGIGDSPFDSPLVQDSMAAALIVAARDCVPTESLRQLQADADEGGRLLERLQSDDLIEVRGERACTTFPIVMDGGQTRYARLTDEVAEDAFHELSSALSTIAGLVQERGWTDWQYHFLWSQLFDSQVAWTELTTRQLVPPLGHLIAWVVFPDHPFRSGTNYYPDTEIRDHWLMVTWRAGGANTTGLIGGIWELVYRAAVGGPPLGREERGRLAELGIVDDAGQVQLPVLREGDPLHELLQDVARRYVDLLEERMPLERLADVTRVDRRHTFAMAYHDISWGILDRLVLSGRIDVPPALMRQADDARPSMRGAAALTPAYAPFIDLIRGAIADGVDGNAGDTWRGSHTELLPERLHPLPGLARGDRADERRGRR